MKTYYLLSPARDGKVYFFPLTKEELFNDLRLKEDKLIYNNDFNKNVNNGIPIEIQIPSDMRNRNHGFYHISNEQQGVLICGEEVGELIRKELKNIQKERELDQVKKDLEEARLRYKKAMQE